MKTKQKTFVALLATLAVGTASVTGLALGLNSGNNAFIAHADTVKAVSLLNESDVKLGTNSISLQAGEEKTFVLNISNQGTYGFNWVSGNATFKFTGLTAAPDPEEPIPDPEEPETDPVEDEVTEERNTHGLNEEITSFYVTVKTPDTAQVTVTSDEDTTIVFDVEYLVDTGVNEFTLKAGVSQTYSINSLNAGKYTIELQSGSGTVTFSGVGTYVLDAEHTSYTVTLESPATTQVTVVSDVDVTLKFEMTYAETVTNLKVGENSLSLKAGQPVNAVIDSISAGYYTFTKDEDSANFKFNLNGQETEYSLKKGSTSFTVYINSPKTTPISIYWDDDSDLVFTLSYSETDPAAQGNTLSVGTQTVQATGWGENYTFTSAEGGTYQITSDSENAYIMVEGEYGAEWVEIPYTFTLTEGGTITFVMSTNDFEDENYQVIITKLA
ncbi:MAG: hypothetical protein K2L12_03640 [Clostridia bacterium]|nr:hypothetical protein [Clostridia bacterium]